VMRTTIEAMAATQGHTQSLHTNALDEALALPTDFSARIARNTQLFLQQETGTTRIIDPWGGSYYLERLTHDLAAKAWGHIREVEALGGMAKAIEAGVPKLRIEEASAKTQARIDAGRQAVIGVNKYQPTDEAPIDVLKVENSTVRRLQIDKLARLRSERNQKDVDAALAALTRSAGTATATFWRWRSTPRAPRPRSAKFPSDGERCSGGTAPKSNPSPASTSGRRPPCPTGSKKCRP